MNLDWDEDTTDLVLIAIAAQMCDMREELDRQRNIHQHQDETEPGGCILDLAEEEIGRLQTAMDDLLVNSK